MGKRTLEDLEMDAFLAKADTLAGLLAHPGWEVYLDLLRDMRQSAMEELAIAGKPKEVRFWQGVASSIGEIMDRPRRMVERASEVQTEETDESRIAQLELRAIMGMVPDREDTL